MPYTPRHGKKGIVYISTTGTGAVALVQLSSWTLDMSTDTADVTPFGALNKQYVQGLKDLKGSFSGSWDSADDSLFIAADSVDGCKIMLYPSSIDPGKYWTGPAWLNATITVSATDAAKVSGSFMANGGWTHP